MELRYRREAAVGFFILVAAAIFVYLLLWLKNTSLRTGELVRTTFDDVVGLKEGDPVRTSGVTVGRVRKVELDAPGQVSVYLELSQGGQAKRDARAAVKALDFFGARYVDYQPGTASEPLDSLIRGTRDQDLSEMAAGLSDRGRELLANTTEMFAPSTTHELRAVLVQARRSLQQLGNAGQAPSQELTRALVSLRQVFQRMDLLLARNTTPATETMGHMRDASASLAQVTSTLTRTSATLDSLMTKINSGRGAVGQLFNDTTIVGDLRRTNTALADLLTDFKANPGRYIHVSVF
ncbi:MAG: MlaD family protein [Gemmatimonadales bacterium]|nr:MlaD family protein [Gemmatimonadales bacterium]